MTRAFSPTDSPRRPRGSSIRHGFPAEVSARPVPTPVLAFEIRRRGAAGAINFTASHNPPRYLGIKFSTSDGAPGAARRSRRRSRRRSLAIPGRAGPARGRRRALRSGAPYLADLGTKVAGRDVGRGVPRFAPRLPLRDRGGVPRRLPRDDRLRALAPPRQPRPALRRQVAAVRRAGARRARRGRPGERRRASGLACDGDADRFGVLDEKGALRAAERDPVAPALRTCSAGRAGGAASPAAWRRRTRSTRSPRGSGCRSTRRPSGSSTSASCCSTGRSSSAGRRAPG